jgi:hypothetical protein
MRGPRPKTVKNSRGGAVGSIPHEDLEPPCRLTKAAETEYWELVAVLKSAGTLERVALHCVANAAVAKVLVERAVRGLGRGGLDPASVAIYDRLLRQYRGTLRELGLTSQPSRTVFRANSSAGDQQSDNDWANRLKVS